MKQIHLFISGFVQGVGYREFVKREAEKLGIVGWVRNLLDSRVEVVAQGPEGILKKFVNICEKGPFLADVQNVAIEWQESKQAFDSFEKNPQNEKVSFGSD